MKDFNECQEIGKDGLPLGRLSHLLYGTKTPNGVGYYHDANLRGVRADGTIFPPDSEFYDEIRRINGIEKRLSPLSKDLVDLRTQVDLCCVWGYDFPQNLGEVLWAIGMGKATFIRMHGQIDPDRRCKIVSFGKALRDWLDGRNANDISNEWDQEIVSWVYEALGERSKLKELLVEKSCLTLGVRCLDCSFWGVMTEEREIELEPYHTERVPKDWKEGGYTPETFPQIRREINGSWDPDEMVWVYECTVDRTSLETPIKEICCSEKRRCSLLRIELGIQK